MPAIDYLSIHYNTARRKQPSPLDALAGDPEIQSLTRGQRDALSVMLSGQSCFNSGGAGTGKSYLVDMFARHADKSIIKCAPTGVAAINIGGSTIHSLFGLDVKSDIFTPDDCEAIYKRFRYSGKNSDMHPLVLADTLIIDEISMCRGDAFAMVGAAIRGVNRNFQRRSHVGKKDLQLLLVGDFFQLPPVILNKADIEIKKDKGIVKVSALDRYRQTYGDSTGFPFLCRDWSFRMNALTEVKRQADPQFAASLNRLRRGEADGLRWIEEHSARRPDPDAIWICGTNARADAINREKLAEISASARSFRTEIEILDPAMNRTEAMQYARAISGDSLTLKKGCRVIATANCYDGSDLVYANGMMGTIEDFECTKGKPVANVRLDNGKRVKILPRTWEIKRPVITVSNGKEELEDKTIAKISQFPLLLGYATTVHKSQGKTLDAVNIDSNCNFMPGQLYVACSRCRDVSRMFLERKGQIPRVAREVLEFEAAGGKSGRRRLA